MAAIVHKDPSFTVGIEEEYLLVDRAGRDLAADPPDTLLTEVGRLLGADQVAPEFLRSQIEIGTKVCKTVKEAQADLCRLRKGVAEVAGRYGLAPIAASTHPFANWIEQQPTDKERYSILARDFQSVARRLLICGTHVHVGIEDDDLRIDLMNQASYFLPHLLALSTSSPFWQGHDTGLLSYRLSVFNELPRTGLPEHFDSFAEFQRHVRVMIDCGLLEDASKLWWDLRPSCRFPTLEMRITDVCTRLEDAVTIAALYLCLLRMLYRLRRSNQRWRQYAPMLIRENRWRAQRYGLDEGMVDFGRQKVVGFTELLDELLYLVRDDAAFFDVEREVGNARAILERGTSAHRQLRVYHDALADGRSRREALDAVVDHLIAETVSGL